MGVGSRIPGGLKFRRQMPQDPAGAAAGRSPAGVAAQGRPGGIERGALAVQVRHGLARAQGEAALGIAGNAPFDLVQRHIQIDQRPQGGQVAHGRFPVDDAAPGGNDRALRADGADDGAFHIQKGIPVERVGKVLKAAAVQGLHEVVAVEEGPVHLLRQPGADGALAGTRHADEDDAGQGVRRRGHKTMGRNRGNGGGHGHSGWRQNGRRGSARPARAYMEATLPKAHVPVKPRPGAERKGKILPEMALAAAVPPCYAGGDR